jgi:hypothetical protein
MVRVREIEDDARTERTWIYLSAKDAVKLKRKAERNGLHGKVLRVLDTSQRV